MSSFGDFIALSDVCDKETAGLIRHEVSDGIIAPGYTDEALAILKEKKKGNYNIIQINTDYRPAPLEHKEVYGITFEQGRQELRYHGKSLRHRKGRFRGGSGTGENGHPQGPADARGLHESGGLSHAFQRR